MSHDTEQYLSDLAGVLTGILRHVDRRDDIDPDIREKLISAKTATEDALKKIPAS